MATYQKALLVFAGIATFNAVISMENATKEIKGQSLNILSYGRRKEHDTAHITALGFWLTKQRKNIPNNEEWNSLITKLLTNTAEQNDLVEKIKGEDCTCCPRNAHDLTIKIINIVKTVTLNLQSNEECASLLVNQAEEILKNYKFPEPKYLYPYEQEYINPYDSF